MECNACGGPLELLGQLGNRYHYRCRNCGLEASGTTKPEELESDAQETDTKEET